MTQLKTNLILMSDSYKLSHFAAYPKQVAGMFSYIEARTKGDVIVPFGLQMFIKKYLLTPITTADIDEAEAFAKAHGEPFNRAGWEKVVNFHNGFLPITIRAVPEGTKVPSGNAIVTVECTDPDLPWLASYIETALQRAVWYPTTIASNDYKNWRAIRRFALETADDESLVPFTLHDFGGRGVSSSESAEVAGAAHLVYFMGSDTIEGVRAANYYYGSAMSAFSVPATEHSIQCAYGPMGQHEYLESVLDAYAKPGAIVSIVIDGYDTFREAQLLCSLKDKIVASGARIVFRPDSGDPLDIIPRLLQLQELTFGSKYNSKGYKVINSVGIIQGDGIDYDSMVAILEKVTSLGYSSSNIVFGSGGALLQKVNRDTYKFAMKASAVLVGGKWVGISKDPVTDPGKKSKSGRLSLYKSTLTGELMTLPAGEGSEEWVDQLVTVYQRGELLNETTLDEVRARAKA
jgi:nicotinamide phosphoribosyltransferase